MGYDPDEDLFEFMIFGGYPENENTRTCIFSTHINDFQNSDFTYLDGNKVSIKDHFFWNQYLPISEDELCV